MSYLRRFWTRPTWAAEVSWPSPPSFAPTLPFVLAAIASSSIATPSSVSHLSAIPQGLGGFWLCGLELLGALVPLVCIGFVAGITVAVGWELAKHIFLLRRCLQIAREPSVCRRERELSKVERSGYNTGAWLQSSGSILPALFKVDASPCNVCLLGSTPRVSEKSLDCSVGQQMSVYNARLVGKLEGKGKDSRVGSLIGNVHGW